MAHHFKVGDYVKEIKSSEVLIILKRCAGHKYLVDIIIDWKGKPFKDENTEVEILIPTKNFKLLTELEKALL